MNCQVPQQPPPPYKEIVDSSMSNQGNNASGYSALQSALASGPAHPPPPQNIHHVQMMQQHPMVQPGQNNNDFRRLVPRAPHPHSVPMVMSIPSNHQRIQIQQVNLVPQRQYVVNGRGMAMAPVQVPVSFAGQPFQLAPGGRHVTGPYLTAQQVQQFNQHNQLQIQHLPPQAQIRNHPGIGFPPPQPQRNGHPLPQNGNAEVITLNESSASPDGQEENVSNGDASDMPILDRQDAQSTTSGGSTESSDHHTDTSRGIFARESEEYNEMSKGTVLPHILTDNVCIMESTEPFATIAPASSVDGDEERGLSNTEPEDQKVQDERKKKVTQRTWARGRGRGRPRGGRGGRRSNLSKENETQKKEKEPDTRTPSPEEKTTEEKKKKRKRMKEAERLLEMDFGPKAGVRIMPENRRNRGSGGLGLMDLDDSPAPSPPPSRRKRGRRRRSADSDVPDELPTDESTAEDDETDVSEYETKTAKKMNYRRPQYCNDSCRSTSIEKSIKKGRRRRRGPIPSDSDESNSLADTPAPEDKPAPVGTRGQVEFEVVGEDTLTVPTEGQKQPRKTTGKEGEGADMRDPPSRRRLRHSSSSYTAESLPGCSASKTTKKSFTPHSSKPETIKSPKPPAPSVVKKEATESAKKEIKRENLTAVPKKEESISASSSREQATPASSTRGEATPVSIQREEAAPAPISRTPSSRVDINNLPPGHPETWDVNTTAEYAGRELGSEIAQLCTKYELDGYVLYHGGDDLEKLRKANFKLDNGKGVPFGPWKKMTSAMQAFKEAANRDSYPPDTLSIEHGLTPTSTSDDVYQWIAKITSPSTAKLLRSAEFTSFGLIGIALDDLIKHTAINYGPALKIFLIVCKAAELLSWPAEVANSIGLTPLPTTSEEFESWLSVFLSKKYANKLVEAQIDLDLMYFISLDEYLEFLGFVLSAAKCVEVAMQIVRGRCDARPSDKIKHVRTTELAPYLTPDSEQFRELLDDAGITSLDRERVQRAGLDGTLAFIVTLKELINEFQLPFGPAKKLLLKVETIKEAGNYTEIDIANLPENFSQNYRTMTVDEVAQWASAFCSNEDVAAIRTAAIDGKTLPFLNEKSMRDILKLSFATTKKLALKLKNLPPVDHKLPANFDNLEGNKLSEWIEQTADLETKSKLANAAMRGGYFPFMTLEELMALGIKFGPALRIISLTQNQSTPENSDVPNYPLAEWSVDDVYRWVSSITAPEVAEQMRNNQIEGETLQKLTFEELMHEVEIPFGPAKVIAAMVKKFESGPQ